MPALPETFFDDFWENLSSLTDDDHISASRLIGEMFATGLIRRDGDDLAVGHPFAYLALNSSDQYLVRRIEEAADAARGEG